MGEGQERVGGVKWGRQIKYKEETEAKKKKDRGRSNSRSNPDSLSLIGSNKKRPNRKRTNLESKHTARNEGLSTHLPQAPSYVS